MATIQVQRVRLVIWQGQDFFAAVPVKTVDGFAVDLSVHDAEAQLRADVRDKAGTVLGTFEVLLVPNSWVDPAGTAGWNAQLRLGRDVTSTLTESTMPRRQGRVDAWIDNGIERVPFATGVAVLQLAVTEDL